MAECKDAITNLKEERENAAKMALEQIETLQKAELQREVLKATNDSSREGIVIYCEVK